MPIKHNFSIYCLCLTYLGRYNFNFLLFHNLVTRVYKLICQTIALQFNARAGIYRDLVIAGHTHWHITSSAILSADHCM